MRQATSGKLRPDGLGAIFTVESSGANEREGDAGGEAFDE
jgi:hypothetical protein